MRSSRNSTLNVALSIAAATLLTGCAAGGYNDAFSTSQASSIYYDYSFAGTEAGYMEQFGPVPVYVRGAQINSERDVQAVVAAMAGSPATGRLKFVPATAPTVPGYSITILFGQAASGVNYCPGKANQPLAAAGGETQVVGIFCLGPSLRSTVTVVAGPRAVQSLTTLLFSPDADPNRRRPRSSE